MHNEPKHRDEKHRSRHFSRYQLILFFDFYLSKLSPCYWGAHLSLKVSLVIFRSVPTGMATLAINARFCNICKINQNLFFSHVLLGTY